MGLVRVRQGRIGSKCTQDGVTALLELCVSAEQCGHCLPIVGIASCRRTLLNALILSSSPTFAAAASVTPHSKKSTASDCATSPSKKGKIGDDLFDVDSDPDLAPGRFSSPVSMSSTPGQMTSSGLSVESSALLQAINSSLGSRIDTANSQLASMNHRMINIESAVTSLDGLVSSTEKCLEEVRKRTEALEKRNHSSAASSTSEADGGTGGCCATYPTAH